MTQMTKMMMTVFLRVQPRLSGSTMAKNLSMEITVKVSTLVVIIVTEM